MKLRNLLVTGEPLFLARYHCLFSTLESLGVDVTRMPAGEIYETTLAGRLTKLCYQGLYGFQKPRGLWRSKLLKRPAAFIERSLFTENKIRALPSQPDLALHLFSLFAPSWTDEGIPYAMLLDYTMALAERHWPAWAPWSSRRQREAWMAIEIRAYRRAVHVFTYSKLTRDSVIRDYGIEPGRVTAVGASADLLEPHEGARTFGSKRLLFNGTHFDRKGGDILVEAFRAVRRAIPQAELHIIGKAPHIREDGVVMRGFVSSRQELGELFLGSDLVVAPARCDPFPTFLIEAMAYGTPSLVSSADGMPEIIEDGRNGVVLGSLSPDATAAAIVALLNDPERLETFSVNGRQKFREQLNWRVVAGRILGQLGDRLCEKQPVEPAQAD